MRPLRHYATISRTRQVLSPFVGSAPARPRDLVADFVVPPVAPTGPSDRACAGTPRDAAAFGDVVLIAVPYSALPRVGRDLAGQFKGKVVIDACNPYVSRDGDIAAWARQKAAGLASAELLPGARLVRAFNAIGYSRLPEIAQERRGRVGMPMAGDDPRANAVASRLVRDIGFEPVVIGPMAMGRYLIPGTRLAGEQSPEEIRKILTTLK